MRVVSWRRPRWAHAHLPTALPKRWVGVAGVLVVMATMMIVPVRNLLLMAVMPGMWRPHGSLFLVKVMLDSQSFPIEETPLGQSPISLDIDKAQLMDKHYKAVNMFPEFTQHMSMVEKQAESDPRADPELARLRLYQPAMDHREMAIALFTLDVFVKACEAANLTYFLVSGSLIGAVRHHGMIPWDDDFDLIMKDSDWKKIRDVFSNIDGFELFTPPTSQWKFYLSSLPHGNRPFKWPNIDIFFYAEDEEYIWSTTQGTKRSLCSKKTDVFPLVTVKFESLNLPVPRHSNLLTRQEFGDVHSLCAKGGYNHRTNMASNSFSLIACKELYNFYPFVFQYPGKDRNSVIEIQKLGHRIISNHTVTDARANG